jgi:hypothetical protein
VVTVTIEFPLTFPLVAVIAVIPGAIAVNSPALVIFPTPVLLLLHVISALIGFPNWSLGNAVKDSVLPTTTEAIAGEIVMVVSLGIGVRVGVGVGVMVGVGVGVGEGAAVTFQSHVFESMPLSLVAITVTFQDPATAVLFIKAESVTPP